MEKSKYNSCQEWAKADFLAYMAARQKGILKEICDRFGWELPKKNAMLPFEEARAFVRSRGFKSWDEWIKYCRSGQRPADIPRSPDKTYKNKGWISGLDWIGKENIYLSFEEARVFVRNLGFEKVSQWTEYCKSGNKPDYIPFSPQSIYKNDGWISHVDWIGAYPGFDGTMFTFEEAKKYIISLNFKTITELLNYLKSDNRLKSIPRNPNQSYKDEGWKSMKDFCGLE